jgi:hypothetical protein
MKDLIRLKITKSIFSLSVLLSVLLLSGCIDLAVNQNRHKQLTLKKKSFAKGEIYTMRGGLGGVFSKGMNHLEDTLADNYQISASSTVWFKAKALSDSIIKRYKANELKGPIILVGHSLGANDQIAVARLLAKENIPVALLITIDPVLPLRIPSNVKQEINVYKPSFVPLFSGLSLKADNPKLTKIENLNVDTLKGMGVNHFTIDKHQYVQKLMVDKILATLKEANRKS